MVVPYRAEKEYALQAVVRAAGLCQQVQLEMVRPISAQKADRSPVTVADYGSQAVICQWLAAAFPGDPVVAEEMAEGLRRPDQTEMLAHVTRYVRRLLPTRPPPMFAIGLTTATLTARCIEMRRLAASGRWTRLTALPAFCAANSTRWPWLSLRAARCRLVRWPAPTYP